MKRVKGESNRKREFTVKYFVTKAISSSIRIPVCRRTFLGILGIKKHRLFGVISRYHKSGTSAKESRGGDRKAEKFVEKKEKVNKFIEPFQVKSTTVDHTQNVGSTYQLNSQLLQYGGCVTKSVIANLKLPNGFLLIYSIQSII